MSIFPTKILLATDGSKEAELATATAADLAKSTNSELEVIYVLNVEPWRFPPDESGRYPQRYEELLEEARQLRDEQVEKVEAGEGSVAEAHLAAGHPAEEIVAFAEDTGVGLIVMGSRGREGLRRALMGSVSDAVVRHAHCPVMVVRGQPVVFPTKILLATDGSEDAELATTTAAELAKSTTSEVHVVHVAAQYLYARGVVAELPEVAQQVLDEQVSRLREAGVTAAEAHLRVGPPAAVIVALAEHMGAGLIVIGSRGLGGIRRALTGSVSDAVVRHVHCPVMVVRPEKEHVGQREEDFLT